VAVSEDPPGLGFDPAAELEPGARGTVVTVLEGGRSEEIPLKYLGTYYDFAGPGYDLHLVELEGPQAERVGVAAGMSGSPVYFDGRLIGALAYRLGRMPKTAVAGVTPIEDILDARRIRPVASTGGEAAIRPIATPVSLSGVVGQARAWLEPHFAELGLVMASGGAMGTSRSAESKLEPGSPVGVELVRGDMRMSATGTVTWIDDDTVWAFGHPFLGQGRVEMPMVTAEVIHTLPDLAGSTKLANVGSEVGAIVEDRQAAIVGRLGQKARMIPIGVQVRGGDYGEQQFRFEVVQHPRLTPLLVAITTVNALFVNNGRTDATTMFARGTVHLKDQPALLLEMAFSGVEAGDPGLAVANQLFRTMSGLWTNPFQAVEVERIELSVDVQRQAIGYRVENVHYDRGPLRPGQELTVQCVLREHRGDTVIRQLTFELPEKLPRSGTLTLAVSNPSGIEQLLGNPLARRLRSAGDLGALVRALSERQSDHRLSGVIYQPGGTVVARGLAFTELPPTAAKLLSLKATSRDRNRGPLVSPLSRAEVEMDGPVQGGGTIRLRLDRGFGTEEN
jgi:hypothetical protein